MQRLINQTIEFADGGETASGRIVAVCAFLNSAIVEWPADRKDLPARLPLSSAKIVNRAELGLDAFGIPVTGEEAA